MSNADGLPVDHADDDLADEHIERAEVSSEHLIETRVHGPVRTQQLAVDLPVARSINLTQTPELIAPLDPRRSRITLISAVEDFYVGVSRGEVDAGTAAIWPAGVPLTLQGRRGLWCKVYALAPRTGVQATLSFIVESLA